MVYDQLANTWLEGHVMNRMNDMYNVRVGLDSKIYLREELFNPSKMFSAQTRPLNANQTLPVNANRQQDLPSRRAFQSIQDVFRTNTTTERQSNTTSERESTARFTFEKSFSIHPRCFPHKHDH